MTKTCALIVFIKNPVEGKVKTRLAAGIGSQAALKVYHKLLDITKQTAIQSGLDCFLFYNEEVFYNDDWSNAQFKKHVQKGSDLGLRMQNAFKLVLSEYDSALIIGSDCPEINSQIILEAQSSLEKNNCVLGPSLDGGYYLLGMNTLHEELFNNILWSSDSVLSTTLDRIIKMGLTVHQLSPLRDIDTKKDLEFYPNLSED